MVTSKASGRYQTKLNHKRNIMYWRIIVPLCLAEKPSRIVHQTNQLMATVCGLPSPHVKDYDIKIGSLLGETPYLFKGIEKIRIGDKTVNTNGALKQPTLEQYTYIVT